MGQFLYIGINAKITVLKKSFRGSDMPLEEIEKAATPLVLSEDLYDKSETEGEWFYTLKPEIAAQDWIPMIQNFYALRYDQEDSRYLDNDQALEVLKKYSSLQDWLALAEKKEFQCYQLDRWENFIYVRKWESVYCAIIENIILSMDGKIVMEGYGSILKFLTRQIRNSLKQYALTKALQVYIW